MLERVAGILDDVWLTFFVRRMFDFDQTFFQQKMLVKHHPTCRPHVLTLLNQQMLYNSFKTRSRGICQVNMSMRRGCVFNETRWLGAQIRHVITTEFHLPTTGPSDWVTAVANDSKGQGMRRMSLIEWPAWLRCIEIGVELINWRLLQVAAAIRLPKAFIYLAYGFPNLLFCEFLTFN